MAVCIPLSLFCLFSSYYRADLHSWLSPEPSSDILAPAQGDLWQTCSCSMHSSTALHNFTQCHMYNLLFKTGKSHSLGVCHGDRHIGSTVAEGEWISVSIKCLICGMAAKDADMEGQGLQ